MAQARADAVFTEKLLPTQRDAVAPDGSLVRLLLRLPGGSMAHFELGAGQVSRPQQHRTVSEIWYVVQGLGRMWRRQDGLEPREIDLRPGVALTIPVGTSLGWSASPAALSAARRGSRRPKRSGRGV